MYKPVIGLEVHVELSTNSKMFCGCSANHFSERPNSNTCPVCLGLPGALPFANRKAIESTIAFGMAFNCKIALFSKFDRKHYFYPDLPKAFQTSQFDLPFCQSGVWSLGDKSIGITRIHLEEDTAKSVHKILNGKKATLIDYNRSGVPLMELVTEPEFDTTDEMIAFLKEVQIVVRYLGISDADMEKGSMRLEANVSVANEAEQKAGVLPQYKIELKNINSFRFLKRAVDIEIARHIELREKGETIPQETRGYDEAKDTTFSQRSKEDAQDYRYFPEPDLPPIRLTQSEIEKIRVGMPELPSAKRIRFKDTYGLSELYIEVLTADPVLSQYYEDALKCDSKSHLGPKSIASAIVNTKLHEKYPEPAGMVKKLLELTKVDFASSEDTDVAVNGVIEQNEKAVSDYKSGNTNVVGFLIGEVQKSLKGKGDVALVRKKLIDRLEV